MEVIEDNRDPFPRTEICTNCKSTVELDIRDCTYRPCSYGYFSERKETFIWECPCCHEKNFIYAYQ